MPNKILTHAELARCLARLGKTVSAGQAMLAEGMWNPDYCAADGSEYGVSIWDDLSRQLKHLEKRLHGKTG